MTSKPKPNDNFTRLKALQGLIRAQKTHMSLMDTLMSMIDTVIKAQEVDVSPEAMVDSAWACREIANLGNEIRKEAEAKQKAIERVICSRFVKQLNNNPDLMNADIESVGDSNGKIQGRFASGYPDVKENPKIPSPKHAPEEYAELCRYFGIPEKTVEAGIMAFHWRRIQDYFQPMIAEGKPIPDFITETFPEFVTQLRSRRNVNIYEEYAKLEETFKQ